MRAIIIAAAASVALVVAHITLGGGQYHPTPTPDPCAVRAQAGPGGAAASVDRVSLNALAGTACDLGVSRERLLISLAGEERLGVSRERRVDSFRQGLRHAIDVEVQARRLGQVEAFVLRAAIERLPPDALLERFVR